MTRKLGDYDFDLPEEQIALYPAAPRPASRLLVVGPGLCNEGFHANYQDLQQKAGAEDSPRAQKKDSEAEAPTNLRARHLYAATFADLPHFVNGGDLIVVNDCKVIAGALEGYRHREGRGGQRFRARVRVNLLRALGDSHWDALARPQKRISVGDRLSLGDHLEAEVIAVGEGGGLRLAFRDDEARVREALRRSGSTPLPPYILSRRAVEPQDRERYQTHFAQKEGAAAAPTAGLHFDADLLARLRARGVQVVAVTLQVGSGTFLPPREEALDAIRLHAEWGEVPVEVAEKIARHKAAGGRVLAVGTTVLRLLESATDAHGVIRPFRGDTDLFIGPGYRFRLVDRLISNFHLPRSTLLVLVSAFAGRSRVQEAYAYAVREKFRFYSFGDACLFARAEGDGAPR